MDQILIESAKQVPALVVMVILVALFLRYLGQIRESAISERQQFSDAIKDLHREHVDERINMRGALKDNTESNKELIRVINDLRELRQRRQ